MGNCVSVSLLLHNICKIKKTHSTTIQLQTSDEDEVAAEMQEYYDL